MRKTLLKLSLALAALVATPRVAQPQATGQDSEHEKPGQSQKQGSQNSRRVDKAAFPAAKARCRVLGRVRSPHKLRQRTLHVGRHREKYGAELPDEDHLCIGPGFVLPNVIVWVSGIEKRWSFPKTSSPARVVAKNGRFVPHVLAVRASQRIEIVNELQETLSWYASAAQPKSPRQRASIKPAAKSTYIPKTDAAVESRSHPWMLCRVRRMPHPIFAVTNSTGRFELPALPPGEYELVARHGYLGTQRKRIVVRPEAKRMQVDIAFEPGLSAAMVRELQVSLDDISNASQRYRLVNSLWPESIDDLVELSPGGIKYLKVKSVPLDPWGNAYYCKGRGRSFVVASPGPDGKKNTADDISAKEAHKLRPTK